MQLEEGRLLNEERLLEEGKLQEEDGQRSRRGGRCLLFAQAFPHFCLSYLNKH